MVGREVLFELEKDDVESGAPVMAAEGLYATDDRGIEALAGVDLEIHEGEIVGIAGVSGNGQRELAEALVGLRQPSAGTITVGDTDLTGASARAFIENGVSFVPEDRYRFGCAEELSVMHNAVMKDYRRSEFGDRLLDYDAMQAYAEELVESFDIRGVSDVAEMRAGDLSGGNLQKLILARELSRDPDVLIANQPTRGVDVGAIEFVRKTILEQRGEGTGVLLISEDLDELFELSDRILVIYEGEFVHDSTPEETSPEEVGLEMTGGRGLESEPSGGAGVAEPAGGDAP
jgi:simple sugar transport system ATP-binding protein